MMKQKCGKRMLVLLMMLCICLMCGIFMTNQNSLNAQTADAESVTTEDNLTFSLFNNSTEYRVTARNKQITEARIPEYYNGLPVTEISDNAFTNCINLTNVFIPYTVTRIGNNAFANCRNLEQIGGMPKIEYIGNNAFAMCAKLDNLILPNTITELGSTILRNNPNTVYSRKSETEMKALNANWNANRPNIVIVYGNELVLTEVYGEDDSIEGYTISLLQNLNTDVDFVLGDTYNGFPLLSIERDAFYYSEFNNFTLRHGEIVPDVDQSGDNFVASYSNDECNHVVNIESGAFYGMMATNIDLLVDVTFNDTSVNDSSYFDYEKGHSTDIFCGSTVRGITLPDNITYIPRSAFSGCLNLREIKNVELSVEVNHISENINTIGSFAFDSCTSLENLYIPGSVKNMGNAVFNNWGNIDLKQTVHINLYEVPSGSGYNWDQDWMGILYDSAEIEFIPISIVFDKEGGTGGTGEIQAFYRQDMPAATAPTKEYYTFDGYYSERNGQGTKYYDADMNSVAKWDRQNTTILYAYWIPYSYTVTFDKNGGTGGTDYVEAIYNQDMPDALAPTKGNLTFEGYFSGEGGEGTKYYNADMTSAHIWNISQDATLYALWSDNARTIHFDFQGGSGGTTEIEVYYMEDLPEGVIKPEAAEEGYEFGGYYASPDGEGRRYYDSDMEPTYYMDQDQDLTLYAYWVPIEYSITYTIDDMRGVTDIPNPNKTTYTIEETPFSITSIETQGYLISWSIESILEGTVGNIEVEGTLTPIEYQITYDLNGGENDPANPRTYTVEDVIVLENPIYKGKMFSRWISSGGEISTIEDSYGDLTLTAQWENPKVVSLSSDANQYVVSGSYTRMNISSITGKLFIVVLPDVKKLDIVGYKGITYLIDMSIASGDIELELDNVKMKGFVSSAITANDSITLYAYGTVGIYGADGTLSSPAGSPAIKCKNFVIKTGSELFIKGGDGTAATETVRGGDAGCGVLITGNYVRIDGAAIISAGLPGIYFSVFPNDTLNGKASEAILSTKQNSVAHINNIIIGIALLSSDDLYQLGLTKGEDGNVYARLSDIPADMLKNDPVVNIAIYDPTYILPPEIPDPGIIVPIG